MSLKYRCLGCMEEYSDTYDMCPHCGYEKDTPPKEAYHMIPGTVLNNRYVIGAVLGFGGFGVTYIGYDEVLKCKVALKEYFPGEFATRVPGSTQVITYAGERTEQFKDGLTKFLDEAKMLAKVQIANGVRKVYNSFVANDTAYIVMEYLEGQTLGELLKTREKLSVNEAKEILQPIIVALKDVHEMGIIHRDIAPDNIFLTKDGKVKLLDFGASRFATTSYSKSLSVIIKQGYAPIEQYRSRGDQGPWTDVYSMAATLYKMITGVTPADAMDRVEKDELKKPSKMGIKIPQNVENALMNAMNLRIEDRTPNMEALEKELYQKDKVKLRFAHLKKSDIGAWPLWTKVALGTAALGLVVFATLLLTGVISFKSLAPATFQIQEGMARVPNLVNEDVGTAENLMRDAQLTLQIVDKQYSEYIPANMVLSQDVEKGQIIQINNIVETVISGGREPIFIADVCGMYQADAIEELVRNGFSIEVIEEYSSFAKGVVFEQSIEARTQAFRGDTVVLKVSMGYDGYLDVQQEVTIPDFAGMTLAEANEEAGKYGLQIVRKGSKKGTGKPGTVIEQSPVSGEAGHQGDIIEVYLVEEKALIRMPDVQYKDEAAITEQLRALGLKVTINYQESVAVAKGKVIDQSVRAYTELEEGAEVVLNVSKGSSDIMVVTEAQWSGWLEALPAGVNSNGHQIETKKQYRYRDKTTMTSSASTMDGWTLYDQVTVTGNYGPWSAWSTDKPADKANRQINNKTQYAYSDYQTKETDEANLNGWTLVNTESYYLDDYGPWSTWSETAVSATDTRKVEQQNQVRTRSRYTVIGSENVPTNATNVQVYETYGEWSDWTETPIEANDNTQVETEVRYRLPVTTMPYDPDEVFPTEGTSDITLYSNAEFLALKPSFEPIGEPYTVYRSRQILSRTYSYTIVTDWSEWVGPAEDMFFPAVEGLEKDYRTAYRYSDKVLHFKYSYVRWTNYSAYSDTAVTESATRKVKTQTVYQYRDKQDVTTYHFYRWGDWTEFRDEAVAASNSRQVEERTVYRYK